MYYAFYKMFTVKYPRKALEGEDLTNKHLILVPSSEYV